MARRRAARQAHPLHRLLAGQCRSKIWVPARGGRDTGPGRGRGRRRDASAQAPFRLAAAARRGWTSKARPGMALVTTALRFTLDIYGHLMPDDHEAVAAAGRGDIRDGPSARHRDGPVTAPALARKAAESTFPAGSDKQPDVAGHKLGLEPDPAVEAHYLGVHVVGSRSATGPGGRTHPAGPFRLGNTTGATSRALNSSEFFGEPVDRGCR